MKARIVKEGNFWIGEVYGDWEVQVYGIPIKQKICWNKVTEKCLSKLGAEIALKKWKILNCPKELEI